MTTPPATRTIRVNGQPCPPVALANDGKTKLRRYEVRAVIYALNKRDARKRWAQVKGSREGVAFLDESEVK